MPSSFKPSSDPAATVSFTYSGREFVFRCWSQADHLLRRMRKSGTFYEIDVLERVRQSLQAQGRTGAAIDVGAFIGTHSVYFSAPCGLMPVLAYEPHPRSFSLLEENIRLNKLDGKVLPIHKALSAETGRAAVIEAGQDNQGMSRIETSKAPGEGDVNVGSLDAELANHPTLSVALIKIDVEGAEIDVLRGAKATIQAHRPILCIEAHTAAKLRCVLSILEPDRYWPVDCRGASPTYILERTTARKLTFLYVTSLWMLRASIPARFVAVKQLLWHRACRAARRASRKGRRNPGTAAPS